MIVTVERKIRNNYIIFNAIHIQSLNANSILEICIFNEYKLHEECIASVNKMYYIAMNMNIENITKDLHYKDI